MTPRLPTSRLLYSTSLRLALAYGVLFAASSMLLVGFLWWQTADWLDRKTDAAIAADARQIKDELRDFGERGAMLAIAERLEASGSRRALYLLADSRLKPLAGNLPAWPEAAAKPGWHWLEPEAGAALVSVRVLSVPLPGGLHLLVGRDIEDGAELRALIVDALYGTAAAGFLLAVGGGLLLRRAILRRVEEIDGAAAAIVRGDLTRRVPTRGGGDAFDRLARTINLMLAQIQQLVEGVRNTSNAVAHDLRTPLAELRARLEELLRARPSIEVTIDEIHKAVADIDHVIEIFNALLRLAEIDSGVRRSGFRRVELAELATEVAELYGPLTEEKEADFVVAAEDGLAVNGDPYLLAQAVGNLVDNAVKYAPRHGTVLLRIAPSAPGAVEITVTDNGPGIAEADKVRVRQRFYRCPTNGGEAGIGLGLSVVDAVARLHDGSLALDDNRPGLIASLRLPAAQATPPPA